MTAKEWLGHYPVLRTRYDRMYGDEGNRQSLEDVRQQMRAIENAIMALDHPIYREVLTLRYTEGNAGRLMPWRDVAFAMYHNDADADLLRVHRLHRKAIDMVKLPNT